MTRFPSDNREHFGDDATWCAPPPLDVMLRSLGTSANLASEKSVEDVVRRCKHELRQHQRSDHPIAMSSVQAVAASLLNDRRGQDAITLLCQHDPSQSDAATSRLYGYAAMAAKDFSNALEAFDRSVRVDPHQPDCWFRMGQIAEHRCVESSGDESAAIKYYERGSFFDDEAFRSTLALSDLHHRQRRLGDAIHVLRVSLIRDARSAILHRALAPLLEKRAGNLIRFNRYRAARKLRLEALESYKILNAREPDRQTLVLQGRLQQLLHQFEPARDSFAKAVGLDPESPIPLSYLASANVDFGDLETAIEQFEYAIEKDPQRAETHFRYSRAKKFQPSKKTRQYTETLTRLIETAKPQSHRQISLNFALAKVLDDIGKYDQAWRHYQRANKIKVDRQNKGQRFHPDTDDECSTAAMTDRMIGFFSKETFRRLSHLSDPSCSPIFIVGMPRSGTTLTEQIVSSHPDIAGAGELGFIHQIRYQLSHMNPGRSPKTDRLADAVQAYPRCLDLIDGNDVRRLGREYLDELDDFRDGATYVTDKMPTNFWHLGLIAVLFPNATIIHCRRNPMDVMVSCFCQNLNPPFCDFDQMLDYHRCYRKIMRHWECVLPMRMFHSQYEDLVGDPVGQSHRLIRHCGLEWSDSCLSFHANDRAVHTPSKWQVRQPVYQSSVEKWRKFERPLQAIAERVFLELKAEAKDALPTENHLAY
ncbi:tetratricopeptide repeat-containing sulfotransferase family protein [Roseiconus lacunae]|uniref:Sulfotransferase n=1 Tax=Roseiconus lacunae TaxID=2605694 RepID=A0ABT7PML5_9BACT|nr:tetratricopeptide repeat-containing sulfotransferase family protein [Roseiconus lacunae]MDM4017524.1 sulfotransferase [Roseiconus lacunae]